MQIHAHDVGNLYGTIPLTQIKIINIGLRGKKILLNIDKRIFRHIHNLLFFDFS